jgi:glycosyl-4,4'-diaponeurosporenoate acyltransferase
MHASYGKDGLCVLFNIVVNACAWTAIQISLALIAQRVSPRHLDISASGWERNGQIYHSLGIRGWKDMLPDAGSWFAGGFSKRRLRGRSFADLECFAREARRGELVHWCAICALPLFALWNSWPGMLVNATYAIAANLPCIIAQRYNRARIAGILRSSP